MGVQDKISLGSGTGTLPSVRSPWHRKISHKSAGLSSWRRYVILQYFFNVTIIMYDTYINGHVQCRYILEAVEDSSINLIDGRGGINCGAGDTIGGVSAIMVPW